jgi:predicted DCC family thiol-disulfide oxidoreductase YuxK
VLYDGACGLCQRSVRLLLRADRRGVLSFTPLQGETAAALTATGRLPAGLGLSSMAFLRGGGTACEDVLVRSDAVLAALTSAGGPWRLAGALRIVPRRLRDAVYDAVARRRYAWFGPADACRLPTPAERARFLP